MKNNTSLEMMKDIIKETSRQIEDNLSSGEYLISYITVYDKNNAVSTNIFLTNQAIILQESNEQERLKKRRFDKISDIKLTHSELYVEFINGYTLIGDVKDSYQEAEKFFNDIRANTRIRSTSMNDLQTGSSDLEPSSAPIRNNPFMSGGRRKKEDTVVNDEPAQSLINGYQPEYKEPEKPKTNFKKIGIIILVALLLIGAIAGISIVAMNASNKAKEEKELAAQIEATKTRAGELLQYQLANNDFYDYIFELRVYFDEITSTQATINLSSYELNLRTLQNDFEDKYEKEFKSTNNAYIIYETTKIDGWMNANRKSILDAFDLFSDNLDGNFKSNTKMLELQSLLENAENEIRKLQSILSEEKEEIKKAYATLTGIEYVPESKPESDNSDNKDTGIKEETKEPVDNNKEDNNTAVDNKDEDKSKDDTSSNPYADNEGFVDEADKNKVVDTGDKETPGRKDDDAYTGA